MELPLVDPQVFALRSHGNDKLARLEGAEDPDEAVEVAQNFEALLATQLVKELRSTLADGFFGDGPGSDVYGGWLDEHLGASLARGWDLDLAGMVKTSMQTKQAQREEPQP